MTELYTTAYYEKIKKQRKNLLNTFLVVLAVYVALIVAIMVIYANEPFGTSLQIPLLIALVVFTVAFVVYAFIFFTISYGRIKKYEYYLYFSVFGKYEILKGTVIEINNFVKDVNGVDFNSFTVLVWSDIKNDYVERLIYVDCEFSVDVNVNDVLDLKVNSSYLLGYKKVNV